ncbi:MAG: hypothetical protein PHC97_03835 [Patescibacteria group bacterium]|nr:hypothetical protein [Patescibacteria group bacterium]
MAIICLASCGAAVNEREIAHVDPVMQSTLEAKICNVDLLFYEGYDSARNEEFWYRVDLSNYEYRDAEILITYKNGDQGPALKAFLGEEENGHQFNINIENGEKIIIDVDRPDSNGVIQDCDAQEFELKL